MNNRNFMCALSSEDRCNEQCYTCSEDEKLDKEILKNNFKIKPMTAVQWLYEEIDNKDMGEIPMWIYDFCNQALKMEKEQIKQVVLNLLNHELGHDDTARWLAERLESGEIDVNDL